MSFEILRQLAGLHFGCVTGRRTHMRFECGEQGIERRLAEFRETAQLAYGVRLVSQPEFQAVQQTGLADPRLAPYQHHPACALPCLFPQLHELRDLGLAPHQRGQLRRGIQPGARAAFPQHLEYFHRRCRIGQGLKTQTDAIEIAGHDATRLLADRRCIRSNAVAQLDRNPGCLADRIRHRWITAGDDEPGMHAGTDFNAVTGLACDGQCCLHGAAGAVFMGLWITEIGQQSAPVRLHDVS